MSLSARSLVLQKRILRVSGGGGTKVAFYRKNTSATAACSNVSSFATIAAAVTTTDIAPRQMGLHGMKQKWHQGENLNSNSKSNSNINRNSSSPLHFVTSHAHEQGGYIAKRCLSTHHDGTDNAKGGILDKKTEEKSLKESVATLRSHAKSGSLTKIQDTIDQINDSYPEWTSSSTTLDAQTLSYIFDAYANSQQTVLDAILPKEDREDNNNDDDDDNDENNNNDGDDGNGNSNSNSIRSFHGGNLQNTIDVLNHASQITNDVDDLLQEYTALYLDHERNGSGKSPPCQLQTAHFDTVIRAWHRLLDAFHTFMPKIQKDDSDANANADDNGSKHHSAAMLALMRVGRGMPQRATYHLEMMERLALLRDGYRPVSPSIDTYNEVLDMWSKSREHLLSSRAETIVRKISSIHHNLSRRASAGIGPGTVFSESLGVEPNAETYKIMIRAWCRVSLDGDTMSKKSLGQAAYSAQDYLIRMQHLLENGNEEFEPSLDDYLNVFRAWSKVGQEQEAGKRAYGLLRKMLSLYRKRLTEVKPDVECYRHVLHAIAESAPRNVNESAAEEILKLIEDEGLIPDSECFTYAIKAWCKSARSEQSQKKIYEKVEKAHELLNHMAAMYYRSGSVVVKPTSVDYNNVLHAISGSGLTSEASARKAEKLLSEMERKFKEGDLRVMPTAESYFNVIRAWNNCPDVETKLDGALGTMAKMKAQYEGGNDACKPTVHCYNAIISICKNRSFRTAGEDLKRRALRTVADTVKNMRLSPETHPTSTTYYMLLEAFSVLLRRDGKDYQKTIESIFHQCCKEGLVDERVVRTFNRIAPYESYRRTVLEASSPRIDESSSSSSDDIILSNALYLPREWTRVAKPGVSVAVDGRIDHHAQYRAVGKHKMKRLRRKQNQILLHGGRE